MPPSPVPRRMTYLELNVDPAYMNEYTAAVFLPHTDIDRFPTVKAALASRPTTGRKRTTLPRPGTGGGG